MRKGGQLFREFWFFLQIGRNCSKNGREGADAGYLMPDSKRLVGVHFDLLFTIDNLQF
jgi:hypothetical protein